MHAENILSSMMLIGNLARPLPFFNLAHFAIDDGGNEIRSKIQPAQLSSAGDPVIRRAFVSID